MNVAGLSVGDGLIGNLKCLSLVPRKLHEPMPHFLLPLLHRLKLPLHRLPVAQFGLAADAHTAAAQTTSSLLSSRLQVTA